MEAIEADDNAVIEAMLTATSGSRARWFRDRTRGMARRSTAANSSRGRDREVAVYTTWIETDFDNRVPPYVDSADAPLVAVSDHVHPGLALTAHRRGTIAGLTLRPGDVVARNQKICEIRHDDQER